MKRSVHISFKLLNNLKEGYGTLDGLILERSTQTIYTVLSAQNSSFSSLYNPTSGLKRLGCYAQSLEALPVSFVKLGSLLCLYKIQGGSVAHEFFIESEDGTKDKVEFVVKEDLTEIFHKEITIFRIQSSFSFPIDVLKHKQEITVTSIKNNWTEILQSDRVRFSTKNQNLIIDRNNPRLAVSQLPSQIYQSDGISYSLVELELLFQKSNSQPFVAPHLRLSPIVEKQSILRFSSSLDVITYVHKDQTVSVAISTLIESLVEQLCYSVNLFFLHPRSKPKSFHFLIPNAHRLISIVYPIDNAQVDEDYLTPLRREYHKLHNLSMDRPFIRIVNALSFSYVGLDEKPMIGSKFVHLKNVHIGVPSPGSQYGEHLVKGTYEYYHYGQDDTDDKGWGCAYRSFQTICSWLNFQKYSARPVPTHLQIQKMVLEADPFKNKSFVGSREWIGALEIGYCLEKFWGIKYKIMALPSGHQIANMGRELQHHFETQGTPVMIGGGVLAYTLLGVAYNEKTGDIRFLILDPHYVGQDHLQSVQKSGWVAWHSVNLFRNDTFYNLCMPLVPKII